MNFRLDIDTKKLESALVKLPRQTSRTILTALGNSSVLIQRGARAKHNFTTRSGQAERSVRIEVDRSSLQARVYLETDIAPYARRLHEGGGGKRDSLGRRMTNKPDKFLYNSARRNLKKVVSNIKDAVANAIKRAGL